MRIIKFAIPIIMLILTLSAFWPAEATNYLGLLPVPAATPTPPSDTANRKLYGWNCVTFNGSGVATVNSACIGTPASINMLGVAYNVGWWQYETADGVYNENYITSPASQLASGQFEGVYITVGAETEPDWLLALTTNNQPAVIAKAPGNPDKPGNVGDTIFWSLPTDSTFLTKWEAMVNHIAVLYGPGGANASTGAKIARVSIVYNGSQLGNELAQPTDCAASGGSCPGGVAQINGGQAACGGSGGFCDRNYNLDAQTAAPGMCGASACGAGGNAAYQAAGVSTFETAFTYEAGQWSAQNDPWALMTAFVPNDFPNIASTNGTAVNDHTISQTIAPWLSTQFTKPAYLFNEALGDGSPGGYAALMHNTNHWCGYNNPSTGNPFLCLAQMNSALGTNLKITSIVGNGSTATVTYTCTTNSRTINNCIPPIGIQAGDTAQIVNTGTYTGNHTVLASPAPNNTTSPYTFAFSTASSSTVSGTNTSEAVDLTRATSNCVALQNAFNNGNTLNVLEIETYLSDYTTCPLTIATQYALMPSS